MQTSYTSQFLESQLESYSEAWKQDHDRAMACWELESRLELGISLFEFVQRVDEHWSEAVREGKLAFTREDATAVQKLYAWWVGSADQVLRKISAREQDGFTVKGAAQFRQDVESARIALSTDIARIFEADEESKSGGSSLAEVVDGLRRKALNRSA